MQSGADWSKRDATLRAPRPTLKRGGVIGQGERHRRTRSAYSQFNVPAEQAPSRSASADRTSEASREHIARTMRARALVRARSGTPREREPAGRSLDQAADVQSRRG